MGWHGKIITTPDSLFGRPRIAGTRIGVNFILELKSSGWSAERIVEEYPHLKAQDLQTVCAFVQECLADELFILKAKAAEFSN